MKKLILAAGFVLSLGACKDDFDKAMDDASDLTNRMCACKDAKCAEKVKDERSALKKKFRGSLEGKKPSEDQMKRAEKLDEKWRSCQAKLDASASL